MQFTINKHTFLTELTVLFGIVEKKTTIPVLSHLLLEASDNGTLGLKATDLDVFLSTSCEANVRAPGALCVPARKLTEIVKSLPEAEIDVAVSDDVLTLKCQRARFKLNGQHKDNFPHVEDDSAEGFISLPAGVLKQFIASTSYALTNDESRYALHALKFELHPDKLRMVATDGHRLAFVEQSLIVSGAPIDALIPKKAIAELLKLLADAGETIEMTHTANHLLFRLGRRLFTSRTLSGQFPNYELVLPKANNHTVVVNAVELLAAVRRVALMSDDRAHAVRWEMGDNRIELIAREADKGEAVEMLSVEYDGPQIITGFNANYLIDVLGLMDGNVRIAFKDSTSQVEFGPVDGTDGVVARHVIMPMRV